MTIDSKAHRAVAKAIMLRVQLKDFGHLINFGDFVASEDQINLLERACNDAATDAITAYLAALPPPKEEETEPVAYAIASYFTERRKEFERDGAVVYHAPMGMARMPLYASPSPLLADEGVAAALDAIIRPMLWERNAGKIVDACMAEIRSRFLTPPAVTP